MLPDVPVLMLARAKSALGNEDINIGGRDFCHHDVPILFATEVASVEDFDPVDLDNKHGGAYNMTGDIRGDLDAIFFDFDAELDRTDAGKRLSDIFLGKEDSIFVADFEGVADQVVVDVLGGLGHVDLLLVVVIGKEIR